MTEVGVMISDEKMLVVVCSALKGSPNQKKCCSNIILLYSVSTCSSKANGCFIAIRPPKKKIVLILTKQIDVLTMTVVQHYSGIVMDVMVDNGEL